MPPVSSVVPLELAPDKMSAYMSSLDVHNYTTLKLINFIRQIHEFEQINENDRLILVKHNLPLLTIVRYASTYDPIREIYYYDTPSNTISPSEEAFAQHYKSLFILCYGYEFNCLVLSVIRNIHHLIDQDLTLIPLLLINMIFLKGLSANQDEQPPLNDHQSVFYAHSKYIDLLFRYLIEKLSFDGAVMKMMRIIEVLIKAQGIMRDCHHFIKSKVDINCVNPLMRSFFSLT